MPRDRYFVVLHHDEWKIRHDGQHSNPFDTQQEAISQARERAKAAADSGHPSQVLVEGAPNSFREEWTYGDDPGPPKR
jgi:hypothetical protein